MLPFHVRPDLMCIIKFVRFALIFFTISHVLFVFVCVLMFLAWVWFSLTWVYEIEQHKVLSLNLWHIEFCEKNVTNISVYRTLSNNTNNDKNDAQE